MSFSIAILFLYHLEAVSKTNSTCYGQVCFIETNPAENDKNENVTAVLLVLLGALDLKDHQFLIKKLQKKLFSGNFLLTFFINT